MDSDVMPSTQGYNDLSIVRWQTPTVTQKKNPKTNQQQQQGWTRCEEVLFGKQTFFKTKKSIYYNRSKLIF